MSSKHSIKAIAVFALLFAILACNGQATPEAVREDSPPPPPPTEPPPEPATATPLPPPTATDEPLPTASSLPTATQKPTATKTQLPPLPDFDDVLMFAGGAGGGIFASEFCQSRFPGEYPASYGKTSSGFDYAHLCIWGVPLDVVFQVELISPDTEINLTSNFKALSSNNTVAWSGHVPAEHDSAVFIQDGVTTVYISPWWPEVLPEGTWNMRVTWPGNEVNGMLNASGTIASQNKPRARIFTTDPRIKSEILPSGVIPQRVVHPGNADKVFGTGFSPSSIVYLLAYADEQKGVYNPTWEHFIFLTGVSVLTDNKGNFTTNFHVNFEQGRLYMLLGVTNPNANLSYPTTGEMNYDEIEAEELFYIQPSAPTFEFIPVSGSCLGAPPQRMAVNQRGYVCTKGDNVRLRNAPNRSGAALDSLPVGTQFTVLAGPSCADNWSWWQIRTDYGVTGWIAEGGDDVDPYFVCPLP